MGLDDARRRLADEEAQREQALIATQQDHNGLLLVEAAPLIQRLLLAARRHVPVVKLRQRFLAERREQFTARQREDRKLRSSGFTSAHGLVGDYEGGTTHTGLALWLNGDGPGGAILFSLCRFEAVASWRPARYLRIQLDLNANTWQVQVRQELAQSGEVVGHRWRALVARENATPDLPKVDDASERARHLEVIEMCAVQLVDHFGIPQVEVEV